MAELVDATLSKRVYYGFESRRLLFSDLDLAINLAAKWLAYTEQTVVRFRHCPVFYFFLEGNSLMVEYWVVVPRDAGSNPVSPGLSRSSMVEHGSVKPRVAGSIPVGTLSGFSSFFNALLLNYSNLSLGVAELVDAIALGAVNYGFKSRCPLIS